MFYKRKKIKKTVDRRQRKKKKRKKLMTVVNFVAMKNVFEHKISSTLFSFFTVSSFIKCTERLKREIGKRLNK